MELIRAVIIDDEARARSTLVALIKEFCPNVEIVAECASVPEGVLAINQKRPKLVFLDIEMPEYSGFELLSFFRDIDFQIVFVTAYNEYALKAFEVSATDYLLKPVDIDKLKVAVDKVSKRADNMDTQNRVDVLKDAFSAGQFNKIALPVSEGLLFVEVPEIVFLEAEGAYTTVWLKNGSRILVSKKLKFFEEILDGRPNFFRSHRSFIVNINYLKKYNKADSSLELDNGKTVYISRERKADFEEQLRMHRVTLGQ
ncbi:MAG: response regulator transcription factor [Taibaiella sp.]|nr:response regulator transcription factor [Taibaiella sp.]